MSLMPYGSDEIASPHDRIHAALLEFTGCIGESLDDICSYGLTIGDSYVPFDPDPDDDCEPDEAVCSQAWVRVTSVAPAFNSAEGWGGSCAITLRFELEVGILRCIDIPEGGEAPTATEVMAYAMQAMEDMNTIQCAAVSCEAWETFTVGSWSPTGPLGGQYGGLWTFSAEL